jgi:hypothetical protein
MSSEDIVTSPAPKRGRPFEPGNPGRKPGSKNRMTALAQAMVEDDGREIIQKGIEMAKAGNERLLRFFIERMLPKQRLIEIPLPEITFASDAADEKRLTGCPTGRVLDIHRAITAGGVRAGAAWIDPLPGGTGGSEVAAAVAGGRPGSTTTRVPTLIRL